jgi:prepilin-type N-terminal cleavage/methylation domain-containing protein
MKARETKGFTLIEVLVVLAIFGVLASMVIAQVLRARLATNEASAIGSLRAINTAQQNYSQKCSGGYAPVLTELSLAGNYLSPDLTGGASVSKSGYILTMVAASAGTPILGVPAGCTATTNSYYATAVPLGVGSSGQRAFATNESSTIFYDDTGVPPADPISPGATPIH